MTFSIFLAPAFPSPFTQPVTLTARLCRARPEGAQEREDIGLPGQAGIPSSGTRLGQSGTARGTWRAEAGASGMGKGSPGRRHGMRVGSIAGLGHPRVGAGGAGPGGPLGAVFRSPGPQAPSRAGGPRGRKAVGGSHSAVCRGQQGSESCSEGCWPSQTWGRSRKGSSLGGRTP